ncbi:hypothetical protein [Gallaecimonas xiamenensis]|uniref:Uncharacterized protein n=1 Tax=Gallaecimonas xiamenensis 3-C-1 TaxID=745411 RepID=K2JYF0_9GAMM|nr:hypothetical protein [Gallaecimonas xiamenensis]EKE70250.1 hypothetical protein B3C1_14148 [Gallaecimonas xiamenensis 3-C-1]
MSKKLQEKWASSIAAMKAVQVAFDLDARMQYAIRLAALKEGLSPSDQIRTMLALPVTTRPKRPRLTVTLNPQDYLALGQRYGLAPDEQLEIKKRVMQDLMDQADRLLKDC